MEVKILFEKLNLFRECREYNLEIWQCPSFVFLILGILNIVAMISTYYIAQKDSDEPQRAALIVIGVTIIFFIISHSITRGFDRLALANKMKTEFVSIVSHQLRTPLSAVRWTLNLLRDGKEKDKVTQENCLELIHENNERMIKLVNDLLNVSRLEMGKPIFNPCQTNLFIIIEKVIANYASFAKANNVTVSLDAPETLPNVFTDPEKISLVVQNLIENAIKYTKAKGEVKINLESTDKIVKFSVRDTGVGIPKSQQKHIFQKFFRADNVMKHQTSGTGLGLFISKSIVEQSEGKIWFESEEGKGTTFYFTLPIYK
jgi:signal transduction histidine kinase